MENPLIRSVPMEDLVRIQQEALCAGDRSEARALVENEMRRRFLANTALHSIDMPVWEGEED